MDVLAWYPEGGAIGDVISFFAQFTPLVAGLSEATLVGWNSLID